MPLLMQGFSSFSSSSKICVCAAPSSDKVVLLQVSRVGCMSVEMVLHELIGDLSLCEIPKRKGYLRYVLRIDCFFRYFHQ